MVNSHLGEHVSCTVEVVEVNCRPFFVTSKSTLKWAENKVPKYGQIFIIVESS